MISILTVVCCLVLSASFAVSATEGASTEETTKPTTGGVPTVTFTNVEKDAPSLYITKEVTNASEDYPAPEEDTFTFVLSLDGTPVFEREYRVFDAAGKEVSNKDGEIPIPFQTDGSGTFTLKAGQTAVFEDVGNGTAYVVKESAKNNYTQTKPAGGVAAVGTVGPKGTVVEFENLYIFDEEDLTIETTTLVVQKSISFPAGYTPWKTDDFTFSVTVGNKAWANEPYTVTNTVDGSMVEKRRTDENGDFTLGVGQTATFEEVPVTKDYIVEEKGLPNDWHVIGKSVQKGAPKTPITFVIFSNVSASFGVSKSMEDSTHPEEDFIFELTKEDGTAWDGAQYYLYNTATGTLVDNEIRSTKDGCFQLRAGQTAIFIGIAEKTIYSVKEIIENDDYSQVIPKDTEGYVRKEVSNSVEILPFINQSLKKDRVLTVKKTVESMSKQDAPEGDVFQFQILRRKNPTEDYKPVDGADYSIQVGTSQRTYRADDEGMFYIQADQTARFAALLPGDYKIIEISDETGHYEPKEKEYVKKEGYIKEGTLEDDAPLSFTFTNLYWKTPPTGIRALSTVWKVLIGVVVAVLLAFAAVILARRRKGRPAEPEK